MDHRHLRLMFTSLDEYPLILSGDLDRSILNCHQSLGLKINRKNKLSMGLFFYAAFVHVHFLEVVLIIAREDVFPPIFVI